MPMVKALTLGAALAALFLLFQTPHVAAQTAVDRPFTQNIINPAICSSTIYDESVKSITKVTSYEGQNAESVRAIIETAVGSGDFPFKWSRVDFFTTPGTDRSLMIVFYSDEETGNNCATYYNDMLTLEELNDIKRKMTFGDM